MFIISAIVAGVAGVAGRNYEHISIDTVFKIDKLPCV